MNFFFPFVQVNPMANQLARLPLPQLKQHSPEQSGGVVFDQHGQMKELGSLIAKGGEGSVYHLRCSDQWVVKLYHAERLQKEGGKLQQKVTAAIELHQQIPELHKLSMAWPCLSLFDSTGSWQGYAMRAVTGRPLSVFRNPQLIRQHFARLDRLALCRAIMQLVRQVQILHRHQIFLGDINPNNFLLDPVTNQLWAIDCDSYQFTHQAVRYPCPVGQESMIPPEHQGKALGRVVRDVHSDTFSLTVLIFMLLMSGRHPYEHIGGGSLAANIRDGHFPYGQSIRPGSNGAIPKGPWYNWWSHLSYKLKDHFMTTFGPGAREPSKRPSLEQLCKLLAQYCWAIEQGHLSAELWPEQAKPSSKG